MPVKTRTKVGVDLRRLVCAASVLVEERQNKSLDAMLANSHTALNAVSDSSRRVHASYAHAWDEVRVKLIWKAFKKYRDSRKASNVPTLVQRGVLSFTLMSLPLGNARTYSEQWLSRPRELTGTTAQDFKPAIEAGSPGHFSFTDVEACRKLLQDVSSFTFMPLPDGAGANVLTMKLWGALLGEHSTGGAWATNPILP